MNDVEKDEMRNNKMSIVYQQNNLLNDFTSLENVAIAMISTGKNKEFAYNAAKKILINVGLSKRLEHFPSDLSVGEQQRVAIARAVINKPQLILKLKLRIKYIFKFWPLKSWSYPISFHVTLP